MKHLLKFILLASLTACSDLTEVNVNPNQLGAEEINSKYVLTSAVAYTANYYVREYAYGYTSVHGISEAMQYMQRDYIGYEINSFVWKPLEYTSSRALTDAQTLLVKSEKEENPGTKAFYKSVASILRGFWFGFYTSAWGDVPYSEALQGDKQVFKPKYDAQKDIFKGVLQELKTAGDALADVGTQTTIGTADLLYGGNAQKWRKLANSLRVRYLVRLSAKKEELKKDGLDIQAELAEILNNPAKYPLFESNADHAAVSHPGTADFNSWAGGPLPYADRSQFYRRKPASPLITHLRENGDPRLTTWFKPVDVQLKVGSGAEYRLGTDGKVKRYLAQYSPGIDTSLYVGLPPAMADPNVYNARASSNLTQIRTLNAAIYINQAAHPHVSYLADMYAQNSNALVKSVLMSYSELNFLLAEAAVTGLVQADAAAYFKKGIEASLDQYQLTQNSTTVYNTSTHVVGAFNRTAFVNGLVAKFNAETGKRLELLMTQKWIALWMTPEFWFDWRRTGLPNLSKNVVEGSNGDKLPLRLIYGTNEYVVNEENTRTSVTKLSPAEDTQWSKMWLLQ
jgi:hypothetical protein